MAANHTAHYALSKWEPSDPFVRVDFNEDNAKIDAALHKLATEKAEKTEITGLASDKADKTQLRALQTQVNALSTGKADQSVVATLQNQVSTLSTNKADKTQITGLQNQITSLSTNKADKSQTTSLQTQINHLSTGVEGRCRMKAGAYVGDGISGRYIDVGFPPAAVLVEIPEGRRNQTSSAASWGGLALAGGNDAIHTATLLSVYQNGFRVYNAGEYQGGFNRHDTTYYYVAWG